jgi:glycosyltransferase involved in cell wall biosynthesis
VSGDFAHLRDVTSRGKLNPVKSFVPCSITAAVCTLNRPSLKATLESLARQRLDKTRYRILVVDNSPDQAATQIVGVETAGVRIDRLASAASSLSIARNTAIECCSTALLAFIDDDARADPDWLGSLTECFDNGSDKVAAWGGPVIPVFETARPEWLDDKLVEYLSIVHWGDQVRTVTDERYLVGTNVAYRTDVLRRAGGFRIDLGRQQGSLLSNEELEIKDRISALGYIFAYSPRPLVYHDIPAARLTPSWFLKRSFWQGVSDGVTADLAAVEKYGTLDCAEVQTWFEVEMTFLDQDIEPAGSLASRIERIRQSGRIRVESYYAKQGPVP